MLPGCEELEELARGDGFNFAAKALERVAVDAREEAALAPGVLVVEARAQGREL